MATHYVDPTGGNDANTGLSFAQRKKTIAGVTPSAGDTVRIMASPVPTSIGSATWTQSSATVTLAGALTANIEMCETAWTASASVTATTSTTAKEGTNSASLAIAAGFTTGLVAYKALGASTDYSSYQQVSLWIRSNVASIASGVFQVCLCSDAAGATPVDTLNIPAMANANVWHAFTIDNAGALGNAIQSVAIYATSDIGAVTLLLDNIIACKASSSADSLSLTSLIGKNSKSDGWYPIASINGTTVKIDNAVNTGVGSSRTYSGTSEAVTTYKRECHLLTPVASGTLHNSIPASGTDGSQITYSGGWDRTDMSTQLTGEECQSWLSGQNGLGNGFDWSTPRNFLTVENLFFFRVNIGFNGSNNPTRVNFTNCGTSGCSSSGLSSTSANSTVDGFYSMACGPFVYSAIHPSNIFISNIYAHNNASTHGMQLAGINVRGYNWNTFNNLLNGVHFSGGGMCRAYTGVTKLNGTAGIGSGNSGATTPFYEVHLKNFTINESTEVGVSTTHDYKNALVFSQNHDGTANNHYVFSNGGTIFTATDQVHGSATRSWKFAPTSTIHSASNPLQLRLAQILCTANTAVTIYAWFRRSNTALTGTLRVKGGQLSGMTEGDYTSSITASANTWEQLSVSFTPTETGVVEVLAECYGGTTHNMWVSDMSFS